MNRRWVGIALCLCACEGPFVPPRPPGPPPPPVAVVQVTPHSATIIAGDTLRLSVTLRDSTGMSLTGRLVSWASSDSTVARVSQSGVVATFDSGAAQIIASAEGHADTVPLIVTPVLFTAVVTGGVHTCSPANNKHVYCWGDNTAGQVGTGTGTLTEALPRPAASATRFDRMSAGALHTCALATDGTAYCWGRNTENQLGRGTTPGNTTVPAPVLTTVKFDSITAGGSHTCALFDGTAYCWGLNANGQIGDGGITPRPTPVTVQADAGLVAITAAVNHTCAITTAGTAECWGQNQFGQVGDSTQIDRHAPIAVVGGLTFTQISAGGGHSCAVTAAGAGYCWGANSRHELASGLNDSVVTAPAAITGGLTFRLVTAGGAHTCGLTTDSLAYCWGKNDAGQVGDSSMVERPAPVAVYGGIRFKDLRAGASHTCGITAANVVYCWGDESRGQLGRGYPQSSIIPRRL